MLKRIVGLLTSGAAEEPRPERQRIELAAAVLLLEVAHADGELHCDEEALIGELLDRHFQLDAETAAELLELAQQVRQDSHDLHQFTRDINGNYDQAEKERIMESLWRLVFADGRLDHFEEALLRQLSSLIGLSHRQMIDAKLKVLEERQEPDGACPD